MTGTQGLIWAEKYRPTTLEQMALSPENRQLLNGFIQAGEIPRLLFYGPPGTGKTTASRIFLKHLDCMVLALNASSERGIDVIREKVTSFAKTLGGSRWNIVFLDEADYLTNDAQAALRNIMEEYSDRCRFILTANYVRRIIDPLQSRCTLVQVSEIPLKERARILSSILKAEAVDLGSDGPMRVFEYAGAFRDLRKMITSAQRSILSKGTLVPPAQLAVSGEQVWEKVRAKDWEGVRTIAADNAFDAQQTIREMFWAIPDTHPNCANLRVSVARVLHDSAITPDPVIAFVGLCAELIAGGA